MLRQDPNEWANKKKAAVERAKQLRAERQQSSENHTFKPQVNGRPAYLDKRTGSAGGSGSGGDSLDHLTGQGGHAANDMFEQPLPGAKGGYRVDDQADSLGQEVKRFPIGKSRVDTKQDLEYKSQFLQQYEKKHATKNQMESQPYAAALPEPVMKDPDESFMSGLRGGDDGGGWNNDTSFGGFDSASKVRKTAVSSSNKEKQSVAGKAEVVQARSRLSLLKSKMQKQSAAHVNHDPMGGEQSKPLLRSNSAHHIDDDHDLYGSAAGTSNNKAQKLGARRRDVENSEHDNDSSTIPKSAPFQPTSMRSAPSAGGSGHSNPPAAARIPPRRHAQAQPPEEENPYMSAPPKSRGGGSSSFSGGYIDEFGPGAAAEDEYGGQQLECPDCHRKFNPIPYEKHVRICAKVFLQKRKVFDSTKMRVEDNPDLAKILQQKKKEEAMAAKKKARAASNHDENAVGGGGGGGANSKWKQQSSAFREAMRAARNVSAAQASGAPLPPVKPSAPDPSLIPCPHCGRRFNEKAAERHIPQCQNIRAKPSVLKRGSGGAGGKVGSAAPSAPASNRAPTSNKAPAPKPKKR